MVFSLFGRKGKPPARKGAEGAGPGVHTRARDTRPSLEAQREAARLTSAKIDQIESEMMGQRGARSSAAPGTTIAGPASGAVPAAPAPAAAPAPPVLPGATVAPGAVGSGKVVRLPTRGNAAGHGTTALIGASLGANAIDIFGSTLPPLLEEAAILYANGQSPQAEAVLRQALEDPQTEASRPLAWMMLLDLYQTTGDKAAFEAAALAYATQFEASAPGWEDAQAAQQESVDAAGGRTSFALPVHVNDAVAGLCARVAQSSSRRGDTVLDCAAVRTVDAAGASRLVALIESFIAAGRGLVVVQPAALAAATREAVETGRRDPSTACWMLALLALRLLGERQQFEDLAIEFCVTYEVSPPSWEALPSWVRIDTRAGARVPPPPAHDPRSAAFTLRGEVLGRMQAELNALKAYASARGDVVIDCRSLRRIDFVAAGELLNAVVALRGANKQVLCIEPNHLVLALLMLMGIVDIVDVRKRRV